jgi:hypothetical protein
MKKVRASLLKLQQLFSTVLPLAMSMGRKNVGFWWKAELFAVVWVVILG